MATKAQAKTSIDTAVTAIKADIDNVLPAAVNIVDGKITFAPTQWVLQLNTPVLATAQSWRDSIVTALTAAGRTSTVVQTLGRRGNDGDHTIDIRTALANYTITGF